MAQDRDNTQQTNSSKMAGCKCEGTAHKYGTVTDDDKTFMKLALREAMLGLNEGGVPIAGVLVDSSTGEELGRGRNQRAQEGSSIKHGETDCLEKVGRRSSYRSCTMYTTLSPCHMCSGAILLYKIPRVVIAENRTFMGAEQLLKDHGVEVVVMDDDDVRTMFQQWVKENPSMWNEDIGEES